MKSKTPKMQKPKVGDYFICTSDTWTERNKGALVRLTRLFNPSLFEAGWLRTDGYEFNGHFSAIGWQAYYRRATRQELMTAKLLGKAPGINADCQHCSCYPDANCCDCNAPSTA